MVHKTKIDLTREDRVYIAKLYNSSDDLAQPHLIERFVQDVIASALRKDSDNGTK